MKMINSIPVVLVVGAVIFGIATLCWWKDEWPRETVIGLLAGAIMTIDGLRDWTRLKVTFSGGVLVLLGIFIILGLFTLFLEVVRKKGHHPMRTPITAVVVGTLIALAGSQVVASVDQQKGMPAVLTVHRGAVHHPDRHHPRKG
jgi:uncharacterized membrane protein